MHFITRAAEPHVLYTRISMYLLAVLVFFIGRSLLLYSVEYYSAAARFLSSLDIELAWCLRCFNVRICTMYTFLFFT